MREFFGAFVVAVVCLASGFLCLTALMLELVEWNIRPDQQYMDRFRHTEAQTLAFGDSLVLHAVESGNGIENLGYPGEPLRRMLSKARYFVKERHGRNIILELSPRQFSIAAMGTSAGDVTELTAVNRYVPAIFKSRLRQYTLLYWREFLEDPSRFFGKRSETQPLAPERNTIEALSRLEQRRIAESQAISHAPTLWKVETRRELRVFKEAMRELRASGVNVCIVEYPVNSDYRAAARGLPTMRQLRDDVAAFSPSVGVEFVDMREAVPDELFLDPHHMLAVAREKFTEQLLDRCSFAGLGENKQ